MCKNVTQIFGITLVFLISSPIKADVTLGLLKKIDSNTGILLLDRNRPVFCKPLGVITLDEMSGEAPNKEKCRTEIQLFYQNHPDTKRFALMHLHKEQTYHYESSKDGCVLYANGRESYSEMLLREGLALIRDDFDNIEWNAKFKRALQSAEMNKRGLHDTIIIENCIK